MIDTITKQQLHQDDKGEWRDSRQRENHEISQGNRYYILEGLQIYHNYIRGHQGLQGKMTPAEKAGIQIEGENKWLTIIKNASNEKAKQFFYI